MHVASAPKLQLLQIGCAGDVHLPSGDIISSARSLIYLGATFADDGHVGSELSRRIGMAKAEFRTVRKIWNHASVNLQAKLRIFKGLVETKLLYGLVTICFTVAQLRQLDGFQAKCLRQILRIPPPHLSRVSNAEVLKRAEHVKASAALQALHLQLLGKILRTADDSPLRTVSFVPGSLQTAAGRYVRRVGRPRREWITTVLPQALQQLLEFARRPLEWNEFLRSGS